jgi:hypothetical protein
MILILFVGTLKNAARFVTTSRLAFPPIARARTEHPIARLHSL